MNKYLYWWKSLWIYVWKSCVFLVNKDVDMCPVAILNTFLLWKVNGSCELCDYLCGNSWKKSGKNFKVNKLFNSEVSTFST